jgi:cytochrome P450
MTAIEVLNETSGCPFASGGAGSLVGVTFTDPAIQAHPNGFYRTLRTDDPVHYDEGLGMYLVSRYEDLQTVFRDAVTFSQERGSYGGMAVASSRTSSISTRRAMRGLDA